MQGDFYNWPFGRPIHSSYFINAAQGLETVPMTSFLPPGRRGRPKQRWVDSVNRDTRSMQTTKDDHDRTGWRRIVSATARWWDYVGWGKAGLHQCRENERSGLQNIFWCSHIISVIKTGA